MLEGKYKVGDIVYGREIGRTPRGEKHILHACASCGKVRWVRFCVASGRPRFQRCRDCIAGHRWISYRRPLVDMLGSPEVGDEVLGRDLGKSGLNENRLYRWRPCPVCGGSPHWESGTYRTVCKRCAGLRSSEAARAKTIGVRRKRVTWNGYVEVFLYPDDPYFPMAKNRIKPGKGVGGYILEHRFLVAQSLGRCLESWEIVHHKNGDKTDNRLENLELHPSQSSHLPSIALERRVRTLEARVTLLEAELVARDALISELRSQR